MKMKSLKRLIGVFLIFALVFSVTAPCAVGLTKQNQTEYPYVFVHGLFGWGRDEGINDVVPYWGASSCDLITELNAQGLECYDASVGPMSSTWDRACELYAQITGTKVDYGAAHAAEHNHDRYGRDYSEPMIKGWGQTDKNGNIKKINLVGHSFGGATIRLLTSLLAYGSTEEQAASSPDDISPLFSGGKGNWVHSVTTICAPHNGTTLAYVLDELNLTTFAEVAVLMYAGVMGRSFLNGFVDFHLEQFGLTFIPNIRNKAEESFVKSFLLAMMENDKSTEDLYPEGAEKINDMIEIVDDVYYFSYAYQSTRKSLISERQVPIAKTFVVLRPFARMMGMYDTNKVSDYPIDESWLPNDGLVNVVSALHPEDEPFESYNKDTSCKTGVWYVMPVRKGHHGSPIGLSESKSYTLDFYDEFTDIINSLAKTN